MSSHHIVREKQEPALLIISLDNFSHELLGQLLEWSPTVIAVAEVAEQLAIYEIKVDVIITNVASHFAQSDVKIIPPASQTPVAAALIYLTNNSYPSVNVITSDLTLTDFEPYVSKINIVLYSGNRKIYPVTNGFKKWKPGNEIVEILSISSSLKISGLSLQSSRSYLTNDDGFFSLEFEDPFVFISEEIE